MYIVEIFRSIIFDNYMSMSIYIYIYVHTQTNTLKNITEF